MTKHTWAILIGLMLSLPVASAWAQPHGRGQGMMEGYGMGPGMMGGYGMGQGMMDGCGWESRAASVPGLTNEQRQKISETEKDYRQKQWQLMEKMHNLAFQSGNPYRDGKFDEQAARKNYDAMTGLRKQMFENSLEQRKRIDNILTAEQREQLQRSWSGSR